MCYCVLPEICRVRLLYILTTNVYKPPPPPLAALVTLWLSAQVVMMEMCASSLALNLSGI